MNDGLSELTRLAKDVSERFLIASLGGGPSFRDSPRCEASFARGVFSTRIA